MADPTTDEASLREVSAWARRALAYLPDEAWKLDDTLPDDLMELWADCTRALDRLNDAAVSLKARQEAFIHKSWRPR